jgi:regulator of protease activity HflC (stomatin/prohibitin superfamily)
MAKSSHSVQKRRRELKMLERRQEKANRRAKRIEAKKLRAEAIARGEDPDAVIDAEATDTAEESDPPATE